MSNGSISKGGPEFGLWCLIDRMEAGLTDHVWHMEEIAAAMDAVNAGKFPGEIEISTLVNNGGGDA